MHVDYIFDPATYLFIFVDSTFEYSNKLRINKYLHVMVIASVFLQFVLLRLSVC